MVRLFPARLRKGSCVLKCSQLQVALWCKWCYRMKTDSVFSLDSHLHPGNTTPSIFTAFLHSQQVQDSGEPHPQNAVKRAYLNYEVCGFFQSCTSIWSSQPSHKITHSINTWTRGYQSQLGGILKPFSTSLNLHQCTATLCQSSPRDAVLCPLPKGRTQTTVVTKPAAELGSTISQNNTQY